MTRAFRILNVFTVDGDRLSGNPLCVFEDGRGLPDATLQAVARQFNLSETTFLLPASRPEASARVRIFTPTFEMPFAGHPTLGTAHVARALGHGDRVTLEMPAGLVQVTADGDAWTLRTARPPTTRVPDASPAELAAMVGLTPDDLAGAPRWVDTGSEQLVLPIASAAAVRAARPDPTLLYRHGFNPTRTEAMAYLWAPDGDDGLVVRFFFTCNGAVIEDPATGSACANLGGYLLATGHRGPLARTLRQGDAVGRPSRLGLRIDGEGAIFVTGSVIELGRGTIDLGGAVAMAT
jgi:PhzF family phenazine biosynthesis protein